MTRKRIRVVDDDELARKLLHLMLERDAGWEVAVAQDGRDAIAKAQEFKPDVVVLDFAMPDMDGVADSAPDLQTVALGGDHPIHDS